MIHSIALPRALMDGARLGRRKLPGGDWRELKTIFRNFDWILSADRVTELLSSGEIEDECFTQSFAELPHNFDCVADVLIINMTVMGQDAFLCAERFLKLVLASMTKDEISVCMGTLAVEDIFASGNYRAVVALLEAPSTKTIQKVMRGTSERAEVIRRMMDESMANARIKQPVICVQPDATARSH